MQPRLHKLNDCCHHSTPWSVGCARLEAWKGTGQHQEYRREWVRNNPIAGHHSEAGIVWSDEIKLLPVKSDSLRRLSALRVSVTETKQMKRRCHSHHFPSHQRLQTCPISDASQPEIKWMEQQRGKSSGGAATFGGQVVLKIMSCKVDTLRVIAS